MTLRPLAFLLCTLAVAVSTYAQGNSQDPQAVILLERSLAALSKGAPVSDVTLIGTARRQAQSDDETGTAILKELVTGQARMDLSFPSGKRSETRANSPQGPVGNWIGPDGTPHPIAEHNLLADGSWFFPPLMLYRLRTSQNVVLASSGSETHNGIDVNAFTAYEQFTGSRLPAHAMELLQHASQITIYLGTSSLLPSAVSFNGHPDNNALRDLPVEIRYSDYRTVSGVQVPFHVQKYVNNGLILDLQFDTAVLNSGLAPDSFSLQ
jgi:hypothetical protein